MIFLKKSVVLFLLLSLVLSLPCYSEEVYEITESELNQLESNLMKLQEDLQKSEEDLQKREERLRKVSESLIKYEQERKQIINIGVPVVIIVVAGAFVGGLLTGVKLTVPP